MDGATIWAAAQLLGEAVGSLSPVSGGRNSRTWKLHLVSGRLAALKLYYDGSGDALSRLDAEYSAFCLAFEAGLPVPQPLGRDDTNGLAVYTWIEGETPDPRQLTPLLCDQFVAMAGLLFQLRTANPGGCSWPARAACLSPGAILGQIAARLSRLQEVAPSHPDGSGLAEFLGTSFIPALTRRREDFFQCCDAYGLDPQAILAPSAETLSPSDFGLHNAVIGPGGALTFVDFEYFGRDDPAKLTADFLLHPAMALSPQLRRRFAGGAAMAFCDSAGYNDRLGLLLPLVGLKWCMILLNEFLPERLARRTFAAGCETERELPVRQLAKARAMLDHSAQVSKECLTHG
jgi:hypothetical protein